MDWKIILSFGAGILLLLVFALLFRMRTRGIVRLLVNSAAGGAVIFALGFFGAAVLPLSPLTALTAGVLGLPGLILIFVVCRFL